MMIFEVPFNLNQSMILGFGNLSILKQLTSGDFSIPFYTTPSYYQSRWEHTEGAVYVPQHILWFYLFNNPDLGPIWTTWSFILESMSLILFPPYRLGGRRRDGTCLVLTQHGVKIELNHPSRPSHCQIFPFSKFRHKFRAYL